MDELVLASALVPASCCTGVTSVDNFFDDFEAASTAVPSSAEQSPELTCMVSEAENWPSLRAAAEGWDFCSEGEEASDLEDLWQDLPEPALSLEGTESKKQDVDASPETPIAWFLVQDCDASAQQGESDEAVGKTTLASLLKAQTKDENKMLPSAAGAPIPAIRARPLQRRNATDWKKEETFLDNNDQAELESTPRHGWTKQHKESWNTKQQRKVVKQQGRRAEQSFKTRGWLQDSVEGEDEA